MRKHFNKSRYMANLGAVAVLDENYD